MESKKKPHKFDLTKLKRHDNTFDLEDVKRCFKIIKSRFQNDRAMFSSKLIRDIIDDVIGKGLR